MIDSSAEPNYPEYNERKRKRKRIVLARETERKKQRTETRPPFPRMERKEEKRPGSNDAKISSDKRRIKCDMQNEKWKTGTEEGMHVI